MSDFCPVCGSSIIEIKKQVVPVALNVMQFLKIR